MGTSSRLIFRIALFALSLATTAAGVGAPPRAHAQEIQITGPLAGQPAVRNLRQHRVDRVQLILPTVGYTLQDEFARSIMTGLEAVVHLNDFFGIGIWGATANFWNAFQIDTDLTSQVAENGQTTDRNRLSMPDSTQFSEQVARLLGIASLHAVFAPLRGKLALFQGAFVDTDFYIGAGVALGIVEERADVASEAETMVCQRANSGMITDPTACLASQTARATRFRVTGTAFVGLNLYFNEWIGMALQWRMFPFNMNPAGTDESGRNADGEEGGGFPDGQIDGDDQRFYFHHMMNIGLIINLPPEIHVSE